MDCQVINLCPSTPSDLVCFIKNFPYHDAVDLVDVLYKALRLAFLPHLIRLNKTQCPIVSFKSAFRRRMDYVLDAPLSFPVPSRTAGIGIGPPGEFSLAAVKISTPVSVTSKVCSRCMLA